MKLKKELKSLSKKELIQLIIAIDNMYKNVVHELEGKNEQYLLLRKDVEEYRESLRLIGDRAYTTLEPTYELDDCEGQCTCVTSDECCNSDRCHCKNNTVDRKDDIKELINNGWDFGQIFSYLANK